MPPGTFLFQHNGRPKRSKKRPRADSNQTQGKILKFVIFRVLNSLIIVAKRSQKSVEKTETVIAGPSAKSTPKNPRKPRVKAIKGKSRPVAVDETITETREFEIDVEDGNEMNTMELGMWVH